MVRDDHKWVDKDVKHVKINISMYFIEENINLVEIRDR